MIEQMFVSRSWHGGFLVKQALPNASLGETQKNWEAKESLFLALNTKPDTIAPEHKHRPTVVRTRASPMLMVCANHKPANQPAPLLSGGSRPVSDNRERGGRGRRGGDPPPSNVRLQGQPWTPCLLGLLSIGSPTVTDAPLLRDHVETEQ